MLLLPLLPAPFLAGCKKDRAEVTDAPDLPENVRKMVLRKLYPGLREAAPGRFVNAVGNSVALFDNPATERKDLLAARDDFDGDGRLEIALVAVETIGGGGPIPEAKVEIVFVEDGTVEEDSLIRSRFGLELLSGEVRPVALAAVSLGKAGTALRYEYYRYKGGPDIRDSKVVLISHAGKYDKIFEIIAARADKTGAFARSIAIEDVAGADGVPEILANKTTILSPELGGVTSVEVTPLLREIFALRQSRYYSVGWATENSTAKIRKRSGRDLILLLLEGAPPNILERTSLIAIARDASFPGLSYLSEEIRLVAGGADWTGPEDLSTRFSFGINALEFRAAIRVFDDDLFCAGGREKIVEGDHVLLYLDLDLEGDFPDYKPNGDDLAIAVTPGNFDDIAAEAYLTFPADPGSDNDHLLVSSWKNPDGYSLLLRIPREILEKRGYRSADSLMGLSLSVTDYDQSARGGRLESEIATDPRFKAGARRAYNTLIPSRMKIRTRETGAR